MQVRSLGWEYPLEKEMTTHCSILAWEIPCKEESGRLYSMGSQRVRHYLATKQQQLFIPMISPGISLEGMMLKLKLQYFGHLMQSWLIGKDSDAGRDWGQEEKGTTQDEMGGWHHWLDGHESEWTPGVGDGQGGLVCCHPWGRRESDTTERLNWTVLNITL